MIVWVTNAKNIFVNNDKKNTNKTIQKEVQTFVCAFVSPLGQNTKVIVHFTPRNVHSH